MSAVHFVVQALLDAAGVTAITSTRIHPGSLKLRTSLPAITVALASETDGYHLGGANQYPDSAVRVACMATTHTGAIDLGEAVKDALQDYSGSPVSGSTSGSVRKHSLDFTDEADDGSAFRRIMEFGVFWR